MSRAIRFLALAAVALVIAPGAPPDWPNLNPTKWVQRPDESITGMDVRATVPTILADDFRCELTGPISDIHIWGSWFDDRLPINPSNGGADPSLVDFKLSFHADIPRNGDIPSHPGAELWRMIVPAGSFAVRKWKEEFDFGEFFFDPTVNDVVGQDHVIWQYNFIIPASEQFIQQQGNIYWLDVQAQPHDPIAVFGWKTSLDHFNDDAVFQNVPFAAPPAPNNWDDMHYPAIHPFHGQSIDLSFALTTVPEPASLALLMAGAITAVVTRRKRIWTHHSFGSRRRQS